MAGLRFVLLNVFLVNEAAALFQTRRAVTANSLVSDKAARRATALFQRAAASSQTGVTGELSVVGRSSKKLEEECGLTNPMHLTPQPEGLLYLSTLPASEASLLIKRQGQQSVVTGPATCMGGSACTAVDITAADANAICIAADATAAVDAITSVAACTYTPAQEAAAGTATLATCTGLKTADDTACASVVDDAATCGLIMTPAVDAVARVPCTFSAATGAGIAPFTPFQTVLKSGFSTASCIKDYMYYYGDKFGAGKHAYKLEEISSVSIVHYDEWVAKEDREQMTPEVCFKFCRTVPDMAFFGIINGGKCYCEPYFKEMAGSSGDCYTACAGDPSQMCGGKDKSAIFSMHSCPEASKYKFIETLSDVPKVDPVLQAKVFYLEAGIKVGDTNTARIGYFHSGIGVEFSDGTNYTVDWWAREGLKNALLPVVTDGQVAWNSKAVIEFQERIKQDYWTKQTLFGTMSGSEWNTFRDFLVSYANDRNVSYYQTFRVTSADGQTTFLDDVVCDSFSQAGLWKLIELGLVKGDAVLKRNYVTLHATSEPVQVNMEDPAEVAAMTNFYTGIYAMAGMGAQADPKDLLQDMVGGLVRVAQTGEVTVYMGSPGIGMYRVVLSSPFVTTGYSEMPMPQ